MGVGGVGCGWWGLGGWGVGGGGWEGGCGCGVGGVGCCGWTVPFHYDFSLSSEQPEPSAYDQWKGVDRSSYFIIICIIMNMRNKEFTIKDTEFPGEVFRTRLSNTTMAANITGRQRKKVTSVIFSPARPRPDQRDTNTRQIRKVLMDEIAWFLVFKMVETRSQLSANTGNPSVPGSGDMAVYRFRREGGNGASRDPRGMRLLTARKKVTVLVL